MATSGLSLGVLLVCAHLSAALPVLPDGALGAPPPSATPTATPGATDAACTGDCSGDGVVGVNELVVGVNIALGGAAVTTCPAFDPNQDGTVTVNELVAGVSGLLYGCGVTPPTPPPSRTPVATASATPTATCTPSDTPTVESSATPSATPTRTPTSTRTQTRTPTAAASVCGGFVGSAPVLCNLIVIPNPVSRSGTIAYRFGVSDLEGDIVRFCFELSYPPLEPQTTCTQVQPSGRPVNAILTTEPGPASVLQFGTYGAALQAVDATGQRSNIITAIFQVQ